MSKSIYVSDVIHGNIQLSNLEKKVISTSIFNRLHYISQNSTAYLTFPTNRTKRFEHCIGTMHLAGEMFKYSISNAQKTDLDMFFRQAENQIEIVYDEIVKKIDGEHLQDLEIEGEDILDIDGKIFKKIYSSFPVEDNLYSVNLPCNVTSDEYKAVYFTFYQAIRLVGLLHDLGHPPMSHIMEKVLEELYYEAKTKKTLNTKEKELVTYIDQYRTNQTSKFVIHEEISNYLSKRLLDETLDKLNTEEKRSEKGYLLLFQIIVKNITLKIFNESSDFFKDMHSVVDGVLDCDRLDYVTRDTLNSGFDVGKIEYDRLLSTMKLIKIDNRFYFSPHIKTKNTLDDFFQRRWEMYNNIIYHHRVVKTDHLLKDCVKRLSQRYLKSKKEVEKSNDKRLPSDISGLWRALAQSPSRKKMADTFLQWNDEWLSTVLKSYYFDKKTKKDKQIYDKLQELVSNKKQYYSLIKKDIEATKLNESIKEKLLEHKGKIDELLKQLEISKQNGKLKKNGKIRSVDKTLSIIRLFMEFCSNSKSIYLLSYYVHHLSYLLEDEDFDANELFKESINEVLTKDNGVEDFLFEAKIVKTGIEKADDLFLYFEKEDGYDFVSYLTISSIEKVLRAKRNLFISLFCYVKRKDNRHLDFDDLIKQIGSNIGDTFADKIITTLDTIKEEAQNVQSK